MHHSKKKRDGSRALWISPLLKKVYSKAQRKIPAWAYCERYLFANSKSLSTTTMYPLPFICLSQRYKEALSSANQPEHPSSLADRRRRFAGLVLGIALPLVSALQLVSISCLERKPVLEAQRTTCTSWGVGCALILYPHPRGRQCFLMDDIILLKHISSDLVHLVH